MHPFRRLLPIAAILIAVAAIGIVGYVVIEGWDFLDAVYMVTITLFTVGFQEEHPLSHAGQVLTMVIIVTGVGTAVYAAGRAVEIIVEGEMSGYQKRKRMSEKIRELRDHYIVCGFGRVGHQVVETFEASGIPFLVIDSKPTTLDELEPKGVPCLIGDATSDDIMAQSGIERAKGLVACSDSDVANVYVTLSARALNPKIYIVARAGVKDTEKKLLIAGANRVISPYFISGIRMAALATLPVASDFLDLITHGGQVDFKMFEIEVPEHSPMADNSLGQTDLRSKTGAVVLAIKRRDGIFDLQPGPSSTIQKGDVLVVIGTQGQLDALEKLITSESPMT